MTYLILGDIEDKKQAQILELKKKILTSPNALEFDYEVLYAAKLDPQTFKKSLLNLPAIGKQRLVIVHSCGELNAQNQDILIEFLAAKPDHVVLILESRDLAADSALAKKLKSYVKVFDYSTGPKVNVFDMTRAMSQRRKTEALQVLADLYEQGIHPLQIMGGVVWFWGKTKTQLSREKFEKGLLVLQEADLNIKRSRLNPEYAIEVLVVKLCGILN